jgi:2-amino-4-hydroxy-6-hydroxymethyldihydropteridine diphosphokinase
MAERPSAQAFLALGSNLGDRRALIDAAVRAIGQTAGIGLLARSSYYRTAPVGPVAQDWFVNIVISIETTLDPADLLAMAHEIERHFGRDRRHEQRWGPRLIDIDLIAYDDVTLTSETLQIPHPRYAGRAFVLVPLAEIAADAVIAGRAVAEDRALIDTTGVERLDWPFPDDGTDNGSIEGGPPASCARGVSPSGEG